VTLGPLAVLVVKSGVSLGGLSDGDRLLALAVCAGSLPPGPGTTEAQANGCLKRCLANEAAFLATDHVELRRWLVDAGWWRRDAAGQRYQRVPLDDLAGRLRAAAEALQPLDLATWVADRRAADQERRLRRREQWAATKP